MTKELAGFTTAPKVSADALSAYFRFIGAKGGRERARRLSPQQRRDAAKKASRAAHKNRKQKGKR